MKRARSWWDLSVEDRTTYDILRAQERHFRKNGDKTKTKEFKVQADAMLGLAPSDDNRIQREHDPNYKPWTGSTTIRKD